MADRASASITIGGAIKQSCISALIAAVDLDGGRADWEGEVPDETSVRQGDRLEAYACELPGGIFQETESFCEEHGLPFVRVSGSCAGAFGPERVVFTGTGPSVQYDLTECGEVALTRCGMRALTSIKAAEAWFASAEFTPPPLTIVADGQLCPVGAEARHG